MFPAPAASQQLALSARPPVPASKRQIACWLKRTLPSLHARRLPLHRPCVAEALKKLTPAPPCRSAAAALCSGSAWLPSQLLLPYGAQPLSFGGWLMEDTHHGREVARFGTRHRSFDSKPCQDFNYSNTLSASKPLQPLVRMICPVASAFDDCNRC